MGIFSFIKKQMLEVIEWKDSSKNIIVYRYKLEDREEIMNSSTLIVRPSQMAIFVHKGQVCDIFTPGTYKLASENVPIITKILALPTGFNSPIKAEIYFINTKQMTGNKWGTQNPIMMRDKDFGNVRLRGFGVYSFKVEDGRRFMEEMFGTNELYTTEDVAVQIKPMLISSIADSIAESKISALDLAANYKEFGDTVVANSQKEFNNFGLKICSLTIENISLPEEVEKALDERTTLGVLEDKVGTYTQIKAAKAMEEAAKNPSGGNLAGLGVGLGAGSAIGNLFAQNLNTNNPKKEKSVKTSICSKCGAEFPEGAKFCPECGAKNGKVCPNCGMLIRANAKFCPECGTKIVKVCSKCGAEIKGSAKFCPECGEKV